MSSYQTITLLLQSERLNQLTLTLLVTTIYHTYIIVPLVTDCPLSVCQKIIKNEGCFIFFTRDWEKKNKKHFQSVAIENDILVFINIKRVFFD